MFKTQDRSGQWRCWISRQKPQNHTLLETVAKILYQNTVIQSLNENNFISKNQHNNF